MSSTTPGDGCVLVLPPAPHCGRCGHAIAVNDDIAAMVARLFVPNAPKWAPIRCSRDCGECWPNVICDPHPEELRVWTERVAKIMLAAKTTEADWLEIDYAAGPVHRPLWPEWRRMDGMFWVRIAPHAN